MLLFVVFSMNTAVSFACSFSSFFHGFHHKNEETVKEHSHSGNHHHEAQGEHDASHNEEGTHKHQDHNSSNSKDDCCSKNLIEIEKAEKLVSTGIGVPNAPFFSLILSAYFHLDSYDFEAPATLFPHHIRWRSPATIPDLRIVIQSFQI